MNIMVKVRRRLVVIVFLMGMSYSLMNKPIATAIKQVSTATILTGSGLIVSGFSAVFLAAFLDEKLTLGSFSYLAAKNLWRSVKESKTSSLISSLKEIGMATKVVGFLFSGMTAFFNGALAGKGIVFPSFINPNIMATLHAASGITTTAFAAETLYELYTKRMTKFDRAFILPFAIIFLIPGLHSLGYAIKTFDW